MTRWYAALGGLAGAVVTACIWSEIGVVPLAATIAVVAGAVAGVVVGAAAGEGALQEAWAGWVGATVVPAVGVGLLNVLVVVVLAAHSQ